MATTPKFAYPFSVVAGHVQVVEQDDPAEVEACVYYVLATEEGSRMELPDFGVADPTLLEGGVDPAVLLAAVAEWEPRAEGLATETIDDLVQKVQVQVP